MAEVATYARLRDQVWFGIAEWLKSGGAIPNDYKLTGELVAVEYTFLPNGKIKVESKDDLRARLGRSSDRADALGLAVHRSRTPEARFDDVDGHICRRFCNCGQGGGEHFDIDGRYWIPVR